MCLIAFNWKNHPVYKMVLVANRDEFFDRPSHPIHQWESGIFAGKDLKAGGTWLGMNSKGRFAAITNYRDLKNLKSNAKTRGNLVKNYLEGTSGPKSYLEEVAKQKDQYDGFNLFVGDSDKLYYFSNYGNGIHEIAPGLYGVSNALLDAPWEKVKKAKSCLYDQIEKNQLEPEALLTTLQSRSIEPDDLLPKTGVSIEQERKLSAQFINIDNYYGTVNSTVLLWKHSGEVDIFEKTFLQIEGKQFVEKISFTVS